MALRADEQRCNRVIDEDVVDAQTDEFGRVLLKAGEGCEPRLPEPVKRRIDYIVDRYGGLGGAELEKVALKVLGLRPEEKEEWLGVPVERYLQARGVRIEAIDLAERRAR